MYGLFAKSYIERQIPVIPVDQLTYEPKANPERYANVTNTFHVSHYDQYLRKHANAGIGLVIGRNSKICVIGFPSDKQLRAFIKKYLPSITDIPCLYCNTDNEFFIPFKLNEKIGYGEKIVNLGEGENKITAKIYCMGSVAVIPPSIMENNTVFYNFANSKHADLFSHENLLEFPEQVISDIKECSLSEDEERKLKTKIEISSVDNLEFTEETSEKEIKFLIYSLLKGGVGDRVVRQLIRKVYPDFASLADLFIEEILNRFRADTEGVSITQLVKVFCDMTSGAFTIKDCFDYVKSLKSNASRDVVRLCLNRLVKEGSLQRYGDKDGWFIRVNDTIQEIAWQDAIISPCKVNLPFELNRYVSIYPKNIIIVAGEPNSGKTTFCLNVAKLNLNSKQEIRYFSSEMGATELKIRLLKFNDVHIDDWKKVKFYERSSDFAPVLNPNGINIIDYMEISDAFYKIAEYTKEIYEALDKGICVIAIQKDKKASMGRGGSFGLEKPRLYLNMGRLQNGDNYLEIVKAKCWANEQINPNGLVTTFKILHGSSFIITRKWQYIEKKEG